MNRNLVLDLVAVTEAAAVAASKWIGLGDRHNADQSAVDAMRRAFNQIPIAGTIVIGEGERDEAPMLYIGEQVGANWGNSDENPSRIDFAVDPLEGTNLCANGLPGALSVMAVAQDGCLLKAPDTYMNKLVVGPEAKGTIDIRKTSTWNLNAIAEAKHCKVDELNVAILDRTRHQKLIEEVRKVGARVRLISDGDVAAAIATCSPDSQVDVLMGIGGAPEGVIAAAAIRCFGGEMQGQLHYRNENERLRAEQMGIRDHGCVYNAEDLAQGNVAFVATGVTDGELLRGVCIQQTSVSIHSLLMQLESNTIRFIKSIYHKR